MISTRTLAPLQSCRPSAQLIPRPTATDDPHDAGLQTAADGPLLACQTNFSTLSHSGRTSIALLLRMRTGVDAGPGKSERANVEWCMTGDRTGMARSRQTAGRVVSRIA
jgi:hypothetical protein